MGKMDNSYAPKDCLVVVEYLNDKYRLDVEQEFKQTSWPGCSMSLTKKNFMAWKKHLHIVGSSE